MLKKLFVTTLLLLIAVAPLKAQEAEVKQLNIAVVDVQQLMKDSKAAKSIMDQGKKLRSKYEKEIKSIEKDLKKTEGEVIAAGKDGNKEQFAERRKEFQKELRDGQKQLVEMNKKMDKAVAKALNVLQDEIVKIVDEMTVKNNYDLVITRSDVVTVSRDIDITADVMKQLNKRLKTVKVKE